MVSPAKPAARLPGIDALRGTVMILMALDHVRDFFHVGAMSFSPTDLTRTSPTLFFTRWITHFCMPVFMFAAGMGAFLWWRQGNRSKSALARFLWTRGLWLIVLELSVMQLAYNLDFSIHLPVFLLVLWIFGLCMVSMAALIYLPLSWLLILSAGFVVFHNCLDRITASQFGSAAWIWNLLVQPGAFTYAGNLVIVGYPLLPWIAVLIAGFCFGQIVTREVATRWRIMLWLGFALTLAFAAVRALNLYGDPAPWSFQHSAVFTLLSFLNCAKYPPSLDFLLMTLGPALLLLAYFDRRPLSAANPLIVFGRVPLFYFVMHFWAIHLLTVLLAWIRYGVPAFKFIFGPVPSMGGKFYPEGFGYGLWVVYAVWIGLVVSLYPLCRWFAKVKAQRRDWWLSYL